MDEFYRKGLKISYLPRLAISESVLEKTPVNAD
jgi:hypothetical protein